MKKSALFVTIATLVTLISSCVKENMDTFGNYYIYMSKDTSFLTLKDTIFINGSDTLAKDSTVKTLGITRSGISPDYPAIRIQLKVDSAYMDSMLTLCNDPLIPSTSKTDKVLYFKNATMLPTDCYELNRVTTLAANERTGRIGLKLNLSKISRLKVNQALVLPISIVSCSKDTIHPTNNRTMLKLSRRFVFKNIAL